MSPRSTYTPPSSGGTYYPPSSLPPQSKRPKHSSADSGFFQEPPKLGNQFLTDIALQRILALYIPAEVSGPLFHDLSLLGETVLSPTVLRYLEDAERHPPELQSHDAFAQRSDVLRTSEGWRRLLELGAREGCVAEGYDGELGRIGQFARYYIFSPSSALVTCPFAMTDGAARLLSHHLAPPRKAQPTSIDFQAAILTSREQEAEAGRRVFKRAFNRLISRYPSVRWTSGQWMTERPGGSDVSRSETTASYAPFSGLTSDKPEQEQGPWSINGYKFFSSATDADMTVLLARTDGNKNLSAFYAPMRLPPSGERNGVRIIRLKNKLGTKALPTAELELKGMRAWMIGNEGEGIREIATVLNITRVHNSISAVSFMRRALAVAKAYSKVRVVANGRPLWTTPLHIRTLAQMELLTRASTHLAFLTVHLLSLAEDAAHTPPSDLIIPPGATSKLLRLLTPLTKAVTAKLSLAVISESVEALGGIGYLENEEPLNLARLLRDAQVLAIWEGTTNVLVTDLISSLKRPSPSGREDRSYSLLGEFIRENLGGLAAGETLERCKVAIWKEWESLERIIEGGSREELTAGGRRILWRLAFVIIGTLLLVDARRDNDSAAVECVRRWVVERELGEGKISRSNSRGDGAGKWDGLLVFGEEGGIVKREEGAKHKM